MPENKNVFADLIPYAARKFVPADASLTDKETLLGMYQVLLDRPVKSSDELERWLLDLSELDAAVSQAAGILYVSMTCQTDDPVRAGQYQDFIEKVEPALKPLHDALNRKYLKLRETIAMDAGRYLVHDRAVRAAVEMFVEKNIPLQTELALLSQEYQALCGAMTVEFDGKEHTLPEMSRYMEDPDRDLRERAWRATAQRRLKDKDRIEQLFQKMFDLRHQVAVNAGFANFRDYQFKSYLRFDYTPEDCRKFHSAVRDVVVPLRAVIDAQRRDSMHLDKLKPWDVSVDPLGRPALQPFKQVDELVDGVGRIMRSLDSELGAIFDSMRASGLLDLSSRKGKAPGGYQNTFDEARQPFIFMNAVGMDDDVHTLLHEAGHAFHASLSAAEPLVFYRHAPMEFCEVASMSMELMASDRLEVFYNAKDAGRSATEFFEGAISVLGWVATIDAFQHWMYENPKHSAAERRSAWLKFAKEFSGGVVDWSGLEEEEACLWHRQLHIFEVPFYYIEYGIAQLGALQIWQRFRRDPQIALGAYKQALTLGGARPLPELFTAAGIRFDFSREIMASLMDDVCREWKRLRAAQ
ncbi:MAG: M3 family oligoendopeptidase [Candidatus Omnitrophica bacterium]|nr:M3 family oligoendopeptidase [Candidatus Omnitrophota bacterium]